MTVLIDPWGSNLIEDYQKIIDEFGLSSFNPSMLPNPNRIMRRLIVFAHRDLQQIANAIKQKKPYYVLSGIMPTSEKIHFGNKMVVENIAYFQAHGAITYILVADLEAAAVRGISLEQAKKDALNFQIPAYIALGLDPKKTIFYFQSQNKDVMHLTYEFSKKITLNEFRAIYGNSEPSRILGALTQAADILFPQLKHKMPGVIPVGIDQDPHIRLTRDIVNRTSSRFIAPSGLYHKYTPALNGDFKMSKSNPSTFIELPENPDIACAKLKNALTGGRKTEAEQKKLGGIPEKCMIFEFDKQHLVESDQELNKIYHDCKSGKLLCGEHKKKSCERMHKFMQDFNKKLEKAKKIKKINLITFK
ncbi:MAG: tryptophan--tRNA ligase [Candidatus Woesearchaeota archaeon]